MQHKVELEYCTISYLLKIFSDRDLYRDLLATSVSGADSFINWLEYCLDYNQRDLDFLLTEIFGVQLKSNKDYLAYSIKNREKVLEEKLLTLDDIKCFNDYLKHFMKQKLTL